MRTLPVRRRLMQSASLLCLCVFGAGSAAAQLAALKAAAGMALPTLPSTAIPGPGVNLGPVGLIRDQTSAVARQLATQQRLANSIGLVTAAQTAARAAAAALTSSIPNGLTAGGLQLAPNLVPAANDATGLHTLQGALTPTQTVNGSATTVNVTQTESRAVLSWTTFNVGQNTTVDFSQKLNGVVQKDWVAFNRVVGQYDPLTGRRDPSLAPAPSQILGHIKADATVVVINANGVFFGPTSQVNAGSLLVSSEELGAGEVQAASGFAPIGLQARNASFLNFGLITTNSGTTSGSFNPAYIQSATGTVPETNIEGSIQIAAGAQITAADSGLIFIGAPRIGNGGTLSVSNGEVGLVAGRSLSFTQTDPTSADQSDIRGLFFTATTVAADPFFGQSYVLNTGLISSTRGYLSLQAGAGAILQRGVLEATTSVSRNGFVDIGAANVELAPGSTIAITPDTDGETIPQSPSSVAGFKASRVRIAGAMTTSVNSIDVGANSLLYAPGGRVDIGFATAIEKDATGQAGSRVFIDTGATINVSGIKDFEVPASRNQITISPVKGNELRDTPNYRKSFLNGATVYVDPRRSGVRADGVAWVGSPLIEAGSYFQNVGVTSAELLTKGGSIALGTGGYNEFTTPTSGVRNDPRLAPDVIVKAGAVLDVSGGWVSYQSGQVQTSQLITSTGQIVDIGNADPNGDYVGLVNPFTQTNTRFGITTSFPNGTLQGVTQVAGYTEGRDAGSLTITAPAVALDGTVYGAAYAGSLQRANAVAGTATAAGHTLQGAPSQLPTGAALTITSDGNILVTDTASIPSVPVGLAYGQVVTLAADGRLVVPVRDPGSLLDPARRDTTQLSDSALSGMDLGALSLITTGGLTFAKGTVTTLAPGGILSASTGRAILVDGNVSAPGGRISLATTNVGKQGLVLTAQTQDSGALGGSAFAIDPANSGSFDVIVNGALLTRGRFVNDFQSTPDMPEGGAYTNGGSISITVAGPFGTRIGAPANTAIDISGSIFVNNGSLIDVSSGAFVAATGSIGTGARGGNLTLIDPTNYAQTGIVDGTGLIPTLGRIRVTPTLNSAGNPTDDPVNSPNPATIVSRVEIASGTVRGQGFAGGGAFNLTTPAFAFGVGAPATGTELPLNFLQQTGFGSANITVFKNDVTPNLFNNGLGGFNVVLATNTVTIGQGQTLSLTQSQYSPFLTTDQTLALQVAANGTDLATIVTTAVPVAAFDQKPIALKFGGLVEVDIAPGGQIVGAGGASLTSAKILDEGTIHLPGGSVTADETLAAAYSVVSDNTNLSQFFAFNANGTIDENALAPNQAPGKSVTNRDVAIGNPIALAGRLPGGVGIRVANGATIDVSGVALINPRAVGPSGAAIVDGRLLAGGTVATLFSIPGVLSTPSRIGETIDAQLGSTIDLSGASATFARSDATGLPVPTPQWSNAGTLSIEGSGGSLSGATLHAAGGAPAATGGTLVVLNPVLTQADDPARTSGRISANQIEAAGFSTFVAEGKLNTVGAVGLTLDRAFFIQSAPFGGGSPVPGNFVVQIGATGDLTINAPLIRFASLQPTIVDDNVGTPGTFSASFNAQALDVQGAVLFDRSLGSVTLSATQDLRLVGAQLLNTSLSITDLSPNPPTPSLTGQLQVAGDLTLKAAQTYPTTGSRFTVASSGPKSTITIEPAGTTGSATPFSAGTNLLIQAANIEQDGIIRAPLGILTLGANTPLVSATGQTLAPATGSLHLGAGSLTSVSADGLSIPYGITTDQIEYLFTPTIAAELTAPPTGQLNLGGANIVLDTGATVNLKGGGDLFAFEFVPGVGGSRDVLSRFNSDPFSGNNGLQYADGRQVYAIVPGLIQPGQALIDPIYSADYGALTSASQVGRQVYLDASPGLAAGWYTLLPAHYALLPGGIRVVEQPEYGTPIPGRSTTLRDGTVVVDGYYGTAGTGLRDSTLRTFTLESQTVFQKASQIAQTSADTVFPARAARNGFASPRIPLDAGRLVIDAITGITANATFENAAATGGRASSTDLGGSNFLIVGAAPAIAPDGTIVLTTSTLQSLNSASLLVGGTRADDADGTTSLSVTGQTITIANDSTTPLSAPELLFAVDGSGSAITIADGASLTASGTLGDARAGDYLINGSATGQTGSGSLVRLSTGPERLTTRTSVQPVDSAPLLSVGLAHFAATSLLLDSSGDLTIASPVTGSADIASTHIALGAGSVAFIGTPRANGLSITPTLEAALAKAATLTIRSQQAVSFAGGQYTFGALTLNTPGLASLDGGAVSLTTGALRLQNDATALATCAPDCGTASLGVTASAIAFGSGQVHALGFGRGVTLAAAGGITFDGTDNTNAAADNGLAGLDTGSAALTLATPLLGDRALPLAPGVSAVLPHLALTTTSALTLTGVAGAAAPAVAGTPGAELSLSGSDIFITDTQVVATAGLMNVTAANGIALAGTASLSTPGYSKVFGDKADPVTASAPGGFLTLTAGNGAIDLGAMTRLSVGGGIGQSGSLTLIAGAGAVNANGIIDGATPAGGGNFTLVSRGLFDLGHFATASATGFTGDIDIRSGAGDLALAAGQSLKASDVHLTADGGATNIAGTIDTSGVNGGVIALYGASGVTLAPTGQLLARAAGYGATDSRSAKGGDITLGTDGTGAITLAAGSIIDVSANRPGDRLIADVRNGVTYYRLAAGDVGGTLSLRAPIVLAAGGNTVDITAEGTVTGARDVNVEAFQRYDLGAIAGNPDFTGVTLADGTVTLDPGASASMGQANFLADVAPGTIPQFIQAFDISATAPKLTGLGKYRTTPGVELDYSGNVQVGTLTADPNTGLVSANNWNLGAGTVDLAGAVAAGLAAPDPAIPGQFYIIPGDEAQVFARFTTLTYRVGGSVTGAAPALAIRAGGNLDLKGSITDGFFAFRDQTTPEAINRAFGLGVQTFQPVLQPNCPNTDCTVVGVFDPTRTPDPTGGNAVTIDFSGLSGLTLDQVAVLLPSAVVDYNAAANGASAGGGSTSGSGDPLGTAVVFPRLPGGAAVRSASYTFVGGADLAASSGKPSANPASVDPSSIGKVIVEGETSYAVNPQGEQGVFNSQLQVESDTPGSSAAAPVAPADFLSSFLANETSYFQTLQGPTADGSQSTTTITLRDPSGINSPTDAGSTFLQTQANAFFTDPAQARFGTDANGAPTVTTTLALAGAFLTRIAPGYGALVAGGQTGETPPVSSIGPDGVPPPVYTNYVQTRVRTGTGSITIAAAGDIDTRNLGATARLNANGGSDNGQVGGVAIYTAGTLANLGVGTATDPVSGLARTVDPAAYTVHQTAFAASTSQPLIEDALAADAVYLDGGGNISLSASSNVLGRRDTQGTRLVQGASSPFIGSVDQPYRVGAIDPGILTGTVTPPDIRINPQLFQTGIGTLGGGTIMVRAGRDVSDLTIVANTSVVGADVTAGNVTPTLGFLTTGGGDVRVSAGRDITSGLYDIGEGVLTGTAARDVTSTVLFQPNGISSNALRVRLADAQVSLSASGRITVRDVTAFGVGGGQNDNATLAFYTPVAAISAVTNGRITLESFGDELPANQTGTLPRAAVLPGSVDFTSLTADLDLAPQAGTINADFLFLSPSPVGQLNLLAGANLRPVAINMDDSDPGLLPGYFSSFEPNAGGIPLVGRDFTFPAVLSSTPDTVRRLYHNASGPTHAGDANPARVAVGGDIQTLILNTPKVTRVSAGRDILNSAVFAQNLSASDVSRVVAGRDLIAASAVGQRIAITTTRAANGDGLEQVGNPAGPFLPFSQGNTFVIGGSGALYVEAGRDAGPFLTSVTATAYEAMGQGAAGLPETLGGGVLSVGNDWDPYLAPVGANVTVSFGVAGGINYSGFRDTYLDPANLTALPDDQFAQNVNSFNQSIADRTRPIYAPVLIAWVQTHAAAELIAAYGTTDVTQAQAYAVFAALSPLRQRDLVQQVYFNELTQTSVPTSVSYLKYSRGYRAVNLLFPPADGYTANNLSGGGNTGTLPVETGNLDLRLATIQSTRGGNITILGPGGRVLGGSTVSTSQQAARRLSLAERVYLGIPGMLQPIGNPFGPQIAAITSIPTGYEGVLTLRGGSIDGFVDQNFLLNQSRIFTEDGGNVALWSSNGDLNAGQGPKTSANFPPVVVRTTPNASFEVDAVGGVTGAGIAAFQPAPGIPAPDVFLIAPRGTVDAGDAGVRVAGNLFVAALAVANADNFKVGGSAFGIPTATVVDASAATAAGNSSAAAAQAAQATSDQGKRRVVDPLSRIVVDVLGYYGVDPCDTSPRPAECPAPRK